jgi:hypothetical protein
MFKIPDATQPLYFVFENGDGAAYTTSKGKIVGNQINLTASDAHEFVIVMTKTESAK